MRKTRGWMALVTIVVSVSSWAGTEKVLHTFAYGKDGTNPEAPLIRDATGNFYGTTANGGAYDSGAVFELTPKSGGGWTESVLHAFKAGSDGTSPAGGLIFDTAGNLYGTTVYGGEAGCSCGTVFEMVPKVGGGWSERVLYSFTAGNDGAYPYSALIFDSAGNLYGTSTGGGGSGCGNAGCGVVFKLTPKAEGRWTESTLYKFTGGNDGSFPHSNLVFDASGNLYGTTELGGSVRHGTVFELKRKSTGWKEEVLYGFAKTDGGMYPVGGVTFDTAGNLYGTSTSGGAGGGGTVFELVPTPGFGWAETTIDGLKDEAAPQGNLVFDSAGNLYGTASSGGGTGNGYCRSRQQKSYCGTVFELTPSSGGWIETVLYRFTGADDGGGPAAGTIIDADGNLYGTTSQGGIHKVVQPDFTCGTVFQLTPGAGGGWIESVLHSFNFGSDGVGPRAGLAFDSSGNLNGTTYSGGETFLGTTFRLAPGGNGTWKESVLHDFFAGKGGAQPFAGVVADASGNLYGTSYGFGAAGYGNVFELTPSGRGWTEKVLYSFAGFSDGAYPYASPTFLAGNLYGTTVYGGRERGTVFELTPASGGQWIENVLYGFQGLKDGGYPYAGLISDSAGNLYGTTYAGGTYPYTQGVVFQLTPGANGQWTETVLYSFGTGTDGANPYGGLIFDAAGNLYGTTVGGGDSGSNCFNNFCGTIFELTPGANGQWTETVLYRFTGGNDGANPYGAVVFDGAGDLYGTTSMGGGNGCGGFGCGTVFQLTPTSGGWTESLVYAFKGGADGTGPTPNLVIDGAGSLYGTTTLGGTFGAGVVFEITP